MRTREEQREYQRNWLKRRREQWMVENGPCASCGSSERLVVDHIDRSTKELKPSEIWSRRKEVRDAELAKCQVLCHDCHAEKTSKELSRDFKSELIHGTIGGYRDHDCRCDPCHQALLNWWREYRKKKKSHSPVA